MTKRKKRLEKGIDSIGKQIKSHEEKRTHAKEEGKIELAEYYDKELKSLEETKERKQEQLDKT